MLNAGTKIVKEIDQSCLISKTVGQVACPGCLRNGQWQLHSCW